MELETENRRIQGLNTELHTRYRAMSLKMKELQEKLTSKETKCDELENQVANINWEVTKLTSKNDKLVYHIHDLTEKYRRLRQLQNSVAIDKISNGDLASNGKVELGERDANRLLKENEELKELASNRLMELEELQYSHGESLKELEKLRMDLKHLPDNIIVETTEYKCLLSRFAVLYNENWELRMRLDEEKKRLNSIKTMHEEQIEKLENDGHILENKLREETGHVKDLLSQAITDNKMLEVKLEKYTYSNEQLGPIVAEMKALIESLQDRNRCLRGDAQRLRGKLTEMCAENEALTKQKDELKGKIISALEKESQAVNSNDKIEEDSDSAKVSSSYPPDSKEGIAQSAKRVKALEEQVQALHNQIIVQKQQEEIISSEMENTGKAYEDMQEQNSRLIQQLKQKDDENFKLISDRYQSYLLHKLVEEERDLLRQRIDTFTNQLESRDQLILSLEEREKFLMQTATSLEKVAEMRSEAIELHKRNVIEGAQSNSELKLLLENSKGQLKDMQTTVVEKTLALEAETFKAKRLQEENTILKRRVEDLQKIEAAGNVDEVMVEEIRELKEILTCPSCKMKRKDAVLTKCFHVFCFDCLRKRYETRQRKCPKCNAAFGANDYHHLYLS